MRRFELLPLLAAAVAWVSSPTAARSQVAEDDVEESQGTEDDAPRPPAPLGSTGVAAQGGKPESRMVRVPGGAFEMGANDPMGSPNERPPHLIVVRPFFIDKTETSVRAFAECVQAKACPPPARSSVKCTYELGEPDLPVTCVRFAAAESYCRFAGKRLPREAEWEFAARGTTRVRYPWGGALATCAYAATLSAEGTARTCSGGKPWPVGSHPQGASTFGVLDLAGNVEEWTSDWYSENVGEGITPRAGASHVLRGGGWLSPPSAARTTARNWGSVLEAGPNVGFRCARD